MRQRDHIELPPGAFPGKRLPNHLIEFLHREKLRDSQLADGDDERGLEDFNFAR